jgi:hypothetical protein
MAMQETALKRFIPIITASDPTNLPCRIIQERKGLALTGR